MARPKTYHIILSDNEVSALRKVIRDKKTCKTDSQIAHTYAVCPATVTNIIQSYVKNGITNIVKYNISPNSSAALRKADGRTEAHLIQIACGPAPEGHSRWTLRLLEKKARIELETPVSRETIRRVLKKMNLDLTSMTIGASRQKRMQNS